MFVKENPDRKKKKKKIFFKIDVLKNFLIFLGKHLWWGLFSIGLQA